MNNKSPIYILFHFVTSLWELRGKLSAILIFRNKKEGILP